MKPTDRQKMCPNCDGRIAFDATECPYCGTEQIIKAEEAAQPSLFKNLPSQENLASFYTPPYAGTQMSPAGIDPSAKKPEAFKKVSSDGRAASAPLTAAAIQAEQQDALAKNAFMPILLLMLGGNLLMLGLLQLFFSDHGILRLEWESSYWFLYCLIALPLFYFGLRKVKTLS